MAGQQLCGNGSGGPFIRQNMSQQHRQPTASRAVRAGAQPKEHPLLSVFHTTPRTTTVGRWQGGTDPLESQAGSNPPIVIEAFL